MDYNKEALLKLDVNEKLALVQELWDSIDEELLPVSEDLQRIAEERYQSYINNPDDVVSLEDLKRKIQEKYSF